MCWPRLTQGSRRYATLAEALVVSLGFDMAVDDPLAAVSVYPDGFAEMATTVGSAQPSDSSHSGGRLPWTLVGRQRQIFSHSISRGHVMSKTPETMNGAESVVRSPHAGGVDVCFANPGTSEMQFVDALTGQN